MSVTWLSGRAPMKVQYCGFMVKLCFFPVLRRGPLDSRACDVEAASRQWKVRSDISV